MGLSGLPVSKVFDYDVEELNRQYGEGNWRFAFWHEHKTVEVARQSAWLQVTYTPVISVGLEHALVTLPYENVLFQKSLASPSLLSAVMADRSGLMLPLYRQEHDQTRFGFPLSRQTMSNWIINACQEYLAPVYGYLRALLASGRYGYQQCDETTWTVLHDGRGAGAKSYIWAHRTSELSGGHAIIIHCWELTRNASHLRDFFQSQEEKVCLTSDAYGAYASYEKESGGKITVSGCFMHARRRFIQALELINAKDLSDEQFQELPEVKGISLIADIYSAENPLKSLGADERQEMRERDVRGKVDAYFAFIHGIDLADPLLSERMRDAVTYSINQETYLRRFLEDGHIPLDNGACERIIKPMALLRRNSLFSNTVRGAEANATVASLVETARANGAEPYYYLKYLLEQMSRNRLEHGTDFLAGLTPWSEGYQRYECDQRSAIISRIAPPGNEKPKTPGKRKKGATAA